MLFRDCCLYIIILLHLLLIKLINSTGVVNDCSVYICLFGERNKHKISILNFKLAL